jgi:S1-C subfamily serine protease
MLAVLCATPGCISLLEPDIAPDTPVQLRHGARALIGSELDAVAVRADVTLQLEPMDTSTIRRAATEAKKAVVSLYVQTSTPHRVRLLPGLGFKVNLRGIGLGSGFFIHPDGYILTNDHVVRDAQQLRALVQSGADYDVRVLARDPVNDLALLKIEAGDKTFPVLPMGDSDEMAVGDIVIAIGNPLGLGHTVTSGIISQTGRNLSGVMGPRAPLADFIQTDTPINPGSSGGPLVTLTGAWVAVNTAGIPEAQNIGFSVPSDQAEEFLLKVLAGDGVFEDD